MTTSQKEMREGGSLTGKNGKRLRDERERILCVCVRGVCVGGDNQNLSCTSMKLSKN